VPSEILDLYNLHILLEQELRVIYLLK